MRKKDMLSQQTRKRETNTIQLEYSSPQKFKYSLLEFLKS